MELAERMTAAITELGQKTSQRAQEIQDLHPERGSYDVKAAKRISARSAADLTEYSVRTEIDIPIFAEALASAMASLGRAASISMEFSRRDVSDLQGLLEQARSLRETLTQTRDNLHSFRDSIAGLPRVTSELNKAKRRALSTMASLLREFDTGVSHVGELIRSLEQIINLASATDGIPDRV
jgi:ABC-type transporter Mla subunit MlaD